MHTDNNRPARRTLSPSLRLAAVLLLVLLALRVALGGKEDGSLQRVQQAGVLVVALDASYPPFEMTDGQGHYSGFDVALAQAIAARLGVRAEFANISFDNLYDALAVHKADIVISGLRYEAERTQDVIYSVSYFDAGQALIVRAGGPISKTADLAGRRVAVELASEGEVEAQKLAAKTAGMQLQQEASPEGELAALRSGAVDAAVADYVTALELVKGQADVYVLSPPFAADALVAAGNSQDRTLMNEVNRIIKALREDGTLERLTHEWM